MVHLQVQQQNPRRTYMPLTDVRIRQSKPQEKPYRIADGGGLFLEVRPNGSKLWRYQYRIGSKPNLFAVGSYPELSLQEARSEHDKARALVKRGVHPSHERARLRGDQVANNANTFGANAEEWFKVKTPDWSAYYAKQVRAYLDRDILPKLGKRPMRSVLPADVLDVLNPVVDRGANAAAILVRQIVSQVFTYAIPKLRADIDPSHPLRRAVVRPRVKHASAKDREELRDLMGRVSTYGGNRTTAIALRLLLLLFIRTGELRNAPWCEFDLDAGVWLIPEARMKMRRKHIVPLPRQAVALLRELQEITGANVHLFPNNRRPRDVMSATTINRALEHMGYPSGYFTGHDFRATASTQLHEMGYRSDVVEMQLAHAKTDRVGAAYNHAEFLPERTAMMQSWADWLETAEADEAPIKRRPGLPAPRGRRRAA